MIQDETEVIQDWQCPWWADEKRYRCPQLTPMMLPSEHSNARFSVSKKSSPHFPSGSVWSGALSPRAYVHLHAGWHLYAAITCCGNNMKHGIAKRPAKIIKKAPFPHIEHDSAWIYEWCLWCVSQAFLRSFVLRFWGTYAPQARATTLPWRESLFIQGFMAPKYLSSSFFHSSSSNFLGVLPPYNKSITYYRLSSNYHLIIIIYGLSIWNSTGWFPFSSFYSRIHPCTGPAHHGDVTRVEICGSISTSKLGAPDGDVWHRLALWHTISGRFLVFFWGGDAPYVFGWWQFLQVFFFPTCCWRWWKKRFWSPDIAFFGGCLNRWDDDFPHSKMTL